MDIGVLITGIAALAAFFFGRGKWLRHSLLLSWAIISILAVSDVKMSLVVLTMAVMDLLIAGVAVAIVTNNPLRYDARVIGAGSMVLMPAHFAMSASQGNADWTLYAAACNAVFVLQCLIVGGWLDGLVGGFSRFFRRMRPLRGLGQHRGR